LNNNFEYVFSGSLQGDSTSNLLIVKNGAKFRQEGDSVPGLPAFKFTSFGSGPIDLADTGDVLWYGDWDDAATDFDTGLFLNDELIVQEGVTTIGGVIVDSLSGVQDGYFISDDGRFIIFEATLVDGTNGAFLATRSATVTEVVPGCSPSGGSMLVTGGSPSIGGAMDLTFDNAQSTPALTYIGVSSSSLKDAFGCGVLLPGVGELLIGHRCRARSESGRARRHDALLAGHLHRSGESHRADSLDQRGLDLHRTVVSNATFRAGRAFPEEVPPGFVAGPSLQLEMGHVQETVSSWL
jgi:hypothetical protein